MLVEIMVQQGKGFLTDSYWVMDNAIWVFWKIEIWQILETQK